MKNEKSLSSLWGHHITLQRCHRIPVGQQRSNPHTEERIVLLRRSHLRMVFISVEGQTLESQRYRRDGNRKLSVFQAYRHFDTPARERNRTLATTPAALLYLEVFVRGS